jgi:hypothetical protein
MVRNVLGNDIERRGERSAGYGLKRRNKSSASLIKESPFGTASYDTPFPM